MNVEVLKEVDGHAKNIAECLVAGLHWHMGARRLRMAGC